MKKISVLGLALAASHATQAQVMLRVGEIAEYNFHLTAPPTTAFGPANFLGGLGTVSWSGVGNFRVSLYNGADLLGSRFSNNPFPNFTAFGAPNLPGGTTFIDFSSILDASIAGRITIEVFESTSTPAMLDETFITGRRVDAGGGYYPGPNAVIDSVRVFTAVPEPSTYGLAFGAAALVLACVRRLRRC